MLINRGKALGAATLLTVLGVQAKADAGQVNISGTAFHVQYHAAQEIAFLGGVSVNYTSSSLTMIAALPRVPASTGATVYVDGLPVFGTYTCTVSSGVAAKSFTKSSPAASWSQPVNFSAAELPDSAYLYISCSVPADGGFYGVTVTG